MVKKFIIFVILCLSCLISFMLWEMSNFTSKQIDVPPSKKVALNNSKVFENLSASLGYKTISHANEENIDAMTFLSFHKFLRRTYPEVFSVFSEQIFSGYSMLLKWESENQISKNPVLLMAHIDVVPEGEISGWDKDPFSGTMKDGVIFGRGAIDNKSSLMSIFEAFDSLKKLSISDFFISLFGEMHFDWTAQVFPFL